MTGFGYLTGGAVFYFAAKAKRLDTHGMGILAAVGFSAGAIGAKLTQILFTGDQGGLTQSGRALFGGLVVGWIGVEITKRVLGIRRSTGDLFALALPAGEAVGRIGCFLNPCCVGTKYDGPLAVFQQGALRHPTQLYSAATALVLFVCLLLIRPRITSEGDLFKCYLIGFGFSRFFLEFIRDHHSTWAGLTPMQWFCAELFVGTIGWWMIRNRKAGHQVSEVAK